MRFPPAALLAVSSVALAHWLPQDADARNLTVVRSPGDSNVKISFKEPTGACRTALNTQKQYTGWASIPGKYPTNLFFWFVEAREPTESLTVWLNGGPGSSSMIGFFTGVGPCDIVEKGLNDYDTVAREWGWDRASNMLFIDQPNQVGFSYDTPTEGTLNLPNETVVIPPSQSPRSWVNVDGTFSTGNIDSTAGRASDAAMAVWHTLQGFLTTFPQYQPSINSSVALSLFAESYGGIYGPVFTEAWELQNQRRLTGQLDPNTTLELRLTSLGILNGCVDRLLQVPTMPAFANNNTYGIKVLSDQEAKLYTDKFSAPAGCQEQLLKCHNAVNTIPPPGSSARAFADEQCLQATKACLEIEAPFFNAGRSGYDIAAPAANPHPARYYADYLNQPGVLAAIGSPLNFTNSNKAVSTAFQRTGDLSQDGHVAQLASLLRRGIRIGLIYGDRDYVCNWVGGEAVSLAVAQQAGGDYASKFAASGYAPIVVNESYVGGEVRQYGNLSFSRIYQAGHQITWFQPETTFQVFARVLLGRSVSMGQVVDLGTFNTTGSLLSTHTAKPPGFPKPTCFVRDWSVTCDDDALDLVDQGRGAIINGVLYSKSADWPLASAKPSATTASKSTPLDAMTGLYTATAIPNGASRSRGVDVSALRMWAVVCILGIVKSF